MICPKCAYEKMKVSKTFNDGAVTKRHRYCPKCSFMQLTEERPIFNNLMSEEEIKEYEEYIEESVSKGELKKA